MRTHRCRSFKVEVQVMEEVATYGEIEMSESTPNLWMVYTWAVLDAAQREFSRPSVHIMFGSIVAPVR